MAANSPSETDLAPVRCDDIGPQRVFHYYEPDAHLHAVVVLDTVRFGVTAGGVRMAPDLSVSEMVRLARAMTYKFALLELPCGGAKAGIWANPTDPERAERVRLFLDAIAPLVASRAYLPGADMGTTAHDFGAVYAGTGAASNLGAQEFEGMLLEDQVTGYGVVVAARTAAERLGWSLAGAEVAIEGFGKVGAGAAKYFAREGARLVAVSTLLGTLYDPAGLAVDRLLALRAAHGDAVVTHYGAGEQLPREALLGVPADILVPGARPDAIHRGNVDAVRARLIVPAANIPYGSGVVARLQDRAIVALPDFATNAGGILVGVVDLQGGTTADVFSVVRDRVAASISRILDAATDRGCAPYDAGVALAREWLKSAPGW